MAFMSAGPGSSPPGESPPTAHTRDQAAPASDLLSGQPPHAEVAEDAEEPDDDLSTAHAEGRRLAEAGDLTGARSLLEQTLAAGELRLGRDHPRLVPIMVDLATIARTLGNLTEAQSQLRRAYGITVAAAGRDDPTALSVEGRLAAVTYRLGEPTEAYDWHIADVGSRVLGEDHPAVRGARQRLAMSAARMAHDPHTLAVEEPTPDLEEFTETDEGPYDTDIDEPGYAPTFAPAYASGYAPTPVSDYAGDGTDDGGGEDLGDNIYRPDSAYEPHAPGVYRRRSTAPDGAVAPSLPRVYPEAAGWPDPQPPLSVTRSGRGHGGGVALVGSLGVAVLIAAGVIAYQLLPFLRPTNPSAAPSGQTTPPAAPTSATTPSSSAVPTTPAQGPPTGVRISDDGGSVTLTWTDPSDGLVPFIISGGRVGEQSQPYETVPAGRTSSTIYGLNERYDYCFTVAAVWSSDVIVPSARTCTTRSPTAVPTRSASSARDRT